jgi:hypothetical protein
VTVWSGRRESNSVCLTPNQGADHYATSRSTVGYRGLPRIRTENTFSVQGSCSANWS